MPEIEELRKARLLLDNAEKAFKDCSYALHLLNCETVRPAEKEEARARVAKIRDLTKKVKAARVELKHLRQRLRFAQRFNDAAQAVTELFGEGSWQRVETKSKLLAKGRKQEPNDDAEKTTIVDD